MRLILILTALLTFQSAAASEFDEIKAAADKGDADAQFKLGVMNERGKDVPKNDVAAAEWYRKAADQGNVAAQYYLGDMYRYGSGVPENYAEAVKWFRKAADQGSAAAQYSLGVMYMNGEGVPESNIKAYAWFSVAKTRAQGHASARGYLDRIKPQMTKQQIAEAQALATQCYESDYKDCD